MTTTATFDKQIRYDRTTRDYEMRLDGQLIGFARTHNEAKTTLDQAAYDMLTHGDCATAEELDAPCSTCGGEGGCPDCDPISRAPEALVSADDLPGIENEPPEPPVWPEPNGRAVTLQSIAIESRLTTCGYCQGIHHIQTCPVLRQAIFAASWTGADLGRGLCQMRWRNHTGFVALLSATTPARLVEYAESYVAFIRANRPDSDLTAREALDSWARDLGGDRGPAAPALQRAA